MTLTELSLFTGAGGGVYASKLLGHKVIGYVEWNDYCQRVIARRIDDGIFDRAPIFGDIRAFVCAGYAERYRGLVDVVSGGFPCQPFSVAGAQLGEDDPRNMWPAMRDVVREVRPRFVFAENVPGLASNGYLGTVLGDLAALGYDAEWCVLGADDCGAPHIRKRLWILAHAQGLGFEARGLSERAGPAHAVSGFSGELGHAGSQRLEERQVGPGNYGAELKAAERAGVSSWWDGDPADIGGEAWGAEPVLGRVADGVAHRKHRLDAIGNGQVSAVAATAFRLLMLRASQ
jgi:DNA (cytosine-5)-methyltransferase 1